MAISTPLRVTSMYWFCCSAGMWRINAPQTAPSISRAPNQRRPAPGDGTGIDILAHECSPRAAWTAPPGRSPGPTESAAGQEAAQVLGQGGRAGVSVGGLLAQAAQA